jgi:peptidyl-prolyl cis-trans isomerase SurA
MFDSLAAEVTLQDMFAIKPRPFACLAVSVFAVALFASCRQRPSAPPAAAVSPDTWATVDGREIKRDTVEKAYRRATDASQPTPSEEEGLTAKLSLLNELIVQDVLMARARELKIEVPDTEVDKAYADAKQNVPDETFQKELTRRNLTTGDLRDDLKRELTAQKVMEREVRDKVAVSDQEISDFFTANKAQFNMPEESYHIAQIVVTPVREAQVANRSGDDATTPQAATQKTSMLMEKLKAGASFRDLATDYSEDPETAPRGGDLGFVPVSRLKQAPPALRDAVLTKAAGSATVVSQGGAHTIVLVVAHEQAGQRDLTTPGVKDRISETLRARKEQLLRAGYLTTIRSDAKVVNHLARRIVEARGKTP